MTETNEVKGELVEGGMRSQMTENIDVQITTAHKFPRNMIKVMDDATKMATTSVEIASMCNYSLPRAGKTIDGPSIRLAEIMVNAFGNLRIISEVVGEDGDEIVARAMCHDLETNNAYCTEIRRRITGKKGNRYSGDMITMTGNAAQAIAQRNAIFKVIPKVFVDQVYNEACEFVANEGNPAALWSRAIAYFKALGVSEEQVRAQIEIDPNAEPTMDDILTARGLANAIKDGDTSVAEVFPKKAKKTKKSEEAEDLLDNVK